MFNQHAAMIGGIEEYFRSGCGRCGRFATPECSARLWQEGLGELRGLCRKAGLVEVVKWGHPCYMHAGRNIAILGAFRNDFRLSFFNASLLHDPAGILEKHGINCRQPDMIRFTDATRVAALAPTISAYLAEAMAHAEQGLSAPKRSFTIDLPSELVDALDADPELAAAFRSLSPGRQKSYALNLLAVKTSATRQARITRFRAHILAGKGPSER